MKTAAQIVPKKSTERRSPRDRKSHGRSRLTNARALLLDQVDGRSALYRRYRDVANAILADQGGIDQCSESRKHLIRRFAAAAVLAEQLEARVVRGEPVNITEFAQLSSTLVRITNHLGLERIPKMVDGLVIDGNVELPSRPSWSSGLRDKMAAAVEEPTE
jgi:hypothetical protein